MTELILPPHLNRQYRPYRDASTQSLLEELLAREELAELSIQQVLADRTMADAYNPDMRNHVIASMFQQAGQAIASSGFALIAQAQKADPLSADGFLDVLIGKILIVRHPAIPRPAPEAVPAVLNDNAS